MVVMAAMCNSPMPSRGVHDREIAQRFRCRGYASEPSAKRVDFENREIGATIDTQVAIESQIRFESRAELPTGTRLRQPAAGARSRSGLP